MVDFIRLGALSEIGGSPLRIFLIFLLRLAVIEWELICGVVLYLLSEQLKVIVTERALRADRFLVLIVLEAK